MYVCNGPTRSTVTPRAVQAMHFMNGLNHFVGILSDQPALKQGVETLGCSHLNLDVTPASSYSIERSASA